MQLAIHEILDKTAKKRTKAEKVKFLQDNYSQALGDVIQFALHPKVKVLLPSGPAPYKPSELADENLGMLYSKSRELYLFVEGGKDDLSQNKREALFIGFLESIHPKDAELIVAAKDKTMPYKITKEVFEEAFGEGFLG